MRDLWQELRRAAPSGMTPLERASVLLMVGVCLTVAQQLTDGVEHWLGAVATVVAFWGTGLISGMSAVWRLVIGGSVLAGFDHTDSILTRPSQAFAAAALVGAIASNSLSALLLPYFDAPKRMRAWAFPNGSRVLWRAGLYYAFYGLLAFVLQLTVYMALKVFDLGDAHISITDARLVASIFAVALGLAGYAGWGSWRARFLDVKAGRRDGWFALFVRSLVRSAWVGGLVVFGGVVSGLLTLTGAKEDLFAGTVFSGLDLGQQMTEWRTMPIATALEVFLGAALVALLATPVIMGLEALSHRVLSPARRSGLVAVLKALTIVLGCGLAGGVLGLVLGAAGGNELSAAARANGIGLAFGLSVGVLVVLWRMRRSRRLTTAPAGPVVPAAGSGGASLPAGIADVVKRIGQ